MTDGPTTPTPPPGGMPGAPASLVDRVKNILASPKTEWSRIDGEPATIGGIYTGYVMILAAIGPIAQLIGGQVFGYGFGIKPSLGFSLGSAVLGYVLTLVGIYVSALVIDALAPSFGGTKDSLKAFKVAAYSSTAVWIAGIFQIIPMLGFLALIGLVYTLYLLYLGLPRLMRVAEDKAVGYTVVVIVVQIVLYFVIGLIVGALVVTFFGAMTPTIRY
jgi:hypothetical protein